MSVAGKKGLRILSFNAEGVVAPYALTEIQKTLAGMGHDIHVVDVVGASQRGQVVPEVLKAIGRFSPDMILTVDLVGLGLPFFLTTPPIPVVSLFFDNPKTYFADKESFFSFEHYYLFSIEESFVGQRKNTFYIPWCFEPEVFCDKGLERTYDVSFVGRLDEAREAFFLELAEDITIDVWGDEGWRKLSHPNLVFHGSADPRKETPDIYNRSKIVICPNAAQFENGISERLYNVMACGACAATDRIPILDKHFVAGQELISYGSAQELKSEIIHVLSSHNAQQAMARAGREKVLVNHTYRRVLEQVLEQVTVSWQQTKEADPALAFRREHPRQCEEMGTYFIRTYYNDGQYSAALNYLHQALERDEHNMSLYLLTLSCMVKTGQTDQAKLFYQLFCSAFPGHEEQAQLFLQPDYNVTIDD